ncbi:fish-egg lectin-like [Anomaloglossus baeobatrachus]|uniref:fish-egg lectin-like n=1 Tax=Anomaloglossus baeobatrachus TaxID=238106 RepID=UPI003F4F917B
MVQNVFLITQAGTMHLILGLLLLCSGAAAAGLQCTDVPGNLKQVDAGDGQVYGVNSNDDIYQWVDNAWKQIPGKLIHVSVGPGGIWGVNRGNAIYKWQDNTWVAVAGSLKQIDAGGEKFVSGANLWDGIYCLNQVDTLSRGTVLPFIQIEGGLKYFSCGLNGCWGVNAANNIYYRYDVQPNACKGSRWVQIAGSLVMVEVATDGSVFGVNSNGMVYKRDGISADNPIGTSWTQLDLSGKFRHVTYDQGVLWLLAENGAISKCENVKVRTPSICF